MAKLKLLYESIDHTGALKCYEQRGYLSRNLVSKPYSENTKTVNGITFTVNTDGTVKANGTATSEATFNVKVSSDNFKLPAGTYKFICTPSGGSTSKYYTALGDGTNRIATDIGGGTVFSLNQEKTIVISIKIASGQVVNNIVFKPMITPELSATYDDYQEYVPSNKDLSEKLESVSSDLGGVSFSVVNGILEVTY